MNGIDAIEQVFTELALHDPLIQVGIGGTNQADIHGYRLVASHPYHATALEDGEQLRLQMIGQISYFVEENRASISSLELARTVRMGIGKGTLLMPKQLAFEKRLSHSTHIHRYHIPTETLGEAVNLPCKHFLTRTVLARNEDICIRLGYLLYHGTEFTHRRTRSPIHGRGSPFFLLSAPFGGLVTSIQQGFDEFGIVPRLHHEIGCTFLDAPHGQVNVRIGSKEHHRQGRVHPLDFVKPIKAFVAGVEGIGKVHVEQHHIRVFFA